MGLTMRHPAGGQVTWRDFMAAPAMLLAGGRVRAQPGSLPFYIIGLNHVTLVVSSLQRSLEFYQRLFDMTVFTSQGNGNLPHHDDRVRTAIRCLEPNPQRHAC